VIVLLLVLISLGAGRAYRTAEKFLLLSQTGSVSEPFDTAPNAIDLIVHTSATSPRLLSALLAFTYPAFLFLFIIEAFLLLLHVQKYSWALAGGPFLIVLSWLLFVPSVILTVDYAWSRLRSVISPDRPIHAAITALTDAACSGNTDLTPLLSPTLQFLLDEPSFNGSREALTTSLSTLRAGNHIALKLSIATMIRDALSAYLTGRFSLVLTASRGKADKRRYTGIFSAVFKVESAQWYLAQAAVRHD